MQNKLFDIVKSLQEEIKIIRGNITPLSYPVLLDSTLIPHTDRLIAELEADEKGEHDSVKSDKAQVEELHSAQPMDRFSWLCQETSFSNISSDYIYDEDYKSEDELKTPEQVERMYKNYLIEFMNSQK